MMNLLERINERLHGIIPRRAIASLLVAAECFSFAAVGVPTTYAEEGDGIALIDQTADYGWDSYDDAEIGEPQDNAVSPAEAAELGAQAAEQAAYEAELAAYDAAMAAYDAEVSLEDPDAAAEAAVRAAEAAERAREAALRAADEADWTNDAYALAEQEAQDAAWAAEQAAYEAELAAQELEEALAEADRRIDQESEKTEDAQEDKADKKTEATPAPGATAKPSPTPTEETPDGGVKQGEDKEEKPGDKKSEEKDKEEAERQAAIDSLSARAETLAAEAAEKAEQAAYADEAAQSAWDAANRAVAAANSAYAAAEQAAEASERAAAAAERAAAYQAEKDAADNDGISENGEEPVGADGDADTDESAIEKADEGITEEGITEEENPEKENTEEGITKNENPKEENPEEGITENENTEEENPEKENPEKENPEKENPEEENPGEDKTETDKYEELYYADDAVTVTGEAPAGLAVETTDVSDAYRDFDPAAYMVFPVQNNMRFMKSRSAPTRSVTTKYTLLAAYDISLSLDGEEYEPEADRPLAVSMAVAEELDGLELELWHIRDDGIAERIEDFRVEDGAVSFTASGFSVYVLVQITKEQTITASDGNEYQISVTYDSFSGVPMEAELSVTELLPGTDAYDAYVQKTAEALGREVKQLNFAHAFDISLIDPETAEHCQPVKPVAVSVRLLNEYIQEGDKVQVVHFPDSYAETPVPEKPAIINLDEGWENPDDLTLETEILAASVNGEAIEFESTGFSIYVVVDHEGGEVLVPRVEFHYIDPAFTDNNDGTYTAPAYQFYNKNNEKQITQILADGESLEMISNPPNKKDDQGNEASFFYGWYLATVEDGADTTAFENDEWTGTITYTWPAPAKVDDLTPISIEDPDGDGSLSPGDYVNWSIGGASGTAVLDDRGTAHAYLVPVYEDFYFINFHMGNKEAEEGLRKNLLTRRLVVFGTSETVTIRIGEIECPSPDPQHQIFAGWETITDSNATEYYYPTTDNDGNERNITATIDSATNEVVQTPNGDEGYCIVITKTGTAATHLDLYPVFAEARWLYFHLGEEDNGALYVPAEYRLTNDDGKGTYFDKLPTSRRTGYDFDGWYVGPESDHFQTKLTYGVKDTGKTSGAFTDEVKNHTFYGVYTMDSEGKKTLTGLSTTQTTGSERFFEITSDGNLYLYKELESLDLYAEWTEIEDTSFQVIVWKQKVTDDVDAWTQPQYEAWVASERTSHSTMTDAAFTDYITERVAALGITVKTYDYVEAFSSNAPISAYSSWTLTYLQNNNKLVDPRGWNYERLDRTSPYSDKDGDFVGFDHSYTRMTTSRSSNAETVAGDKSTVVNVYYDREVHTLTFQVQDYTYTPTTSNNGMQYGLVNGDEYVQLTKNANNWTYYKYTEVTSPDTSETYYVLYEGGYWTVKYYSGYGWYVYYNNYNYSYSTNASIFGPMLRRSSEQYTGTRYTRSNNQSWQNKYSITSLYGQSVSEYFSEGTVPLGTKYLGAVWKDVTTPTVKYTDILSSVGSMPEQDVLFQLQYYNRSKVVHYFVESLDQTTAADGTNRRSFTVNGANVIFDLLKSVRLSYNFLTFDEEYHRIDGYDRDDSYSEPYTFYTAADGKHRTSSMADVNYLYYVRVRKSLTFIVNYPTAAGVQFRNVDGNLVDWDDSSAVKSGDSNGVVRTEIVKYGESLSSFQSDGSELIAPEHYYFDGWYKDSTCTVKFNFNDTMPSGDVMAYAKWTPDYFLIKIDPNGAEIDHINHNSNAYGADATALNRDQITYTDDNGLVVVERAADSGFYENRSTYFFADYGEQLGRYAVSRSHVPIGDTAAAVYTATTGRPVYVYVNVQYLGGTIDGEWGVPYDLRNALYVDATYGTGQYRNNDPSQGETELYTLYKFYHDLINSEYINNPGWWDCDGARILSFNAWKQQFMKTKDDGTPQLYRKCNGKETWVFLGWFKDDENTPYNFADPVDGAFTLTARWRLDGGYTIQYTPEYWLDSSDGNTYQINGRMESWLDPDNGQLSYTDGAKTTIFKQPTELTKNGTPVTDNSLTFRGWRVVSMTTGEDANGNAVVTYTPLEYDAAGNVVYYDPGVDYTVLVDYADSNNVIHMQAVYEETLSSVRRPEVAKALTLDANSRYLGYLVDANGDELTDDYWFTKSGVGTIVMDAAEDQIIFGDIQTNAAIHLYQYASELTETVSGVPLDPVGTNYFANQYNHLLIGFDKEKNPELIKNETTGASQPYVPNYPADSVISVKPNDDETIYAIWEPMVYITFKNETAITNTSPGFPGGNVSFRISAEGENAAALQVINVKEGLYNRRALDSLDEVVVAPGEEITLAFPKGDEKTIKIEGTNELGTGKQLHWNTSVNGTDSAAYDETEDVIYTHDSCGHVLAHGKTNNQKDFTFYEQLLTDEEGLVVTFTALEVDYALLCEDNFPAGISGGVNQETDYSAAYIEEKDDNGNYHEELLPNPSTCFGYEFKGWAYTADATEPVIPADPVADRKIGNLYAFFTEPEDPSYLEVVGETTVRRLYAVWEINDEAGKVYVYKTVSEHGNPLTQFEFTVDITATYRDPNQNNDDQPISGHGSFTLAHGEHAVLQSSSDTETGTIQTAITIYHTDGTAPSSLSPITAQASNIYSGGGFAGTERIAVTETGKEYYTTNLEVRAKTTGHEINVDNVNKKVSLSAMDTGGTVVFTNTRETAKIDVKKVLVSNEAAGTFQFHAFYTDGSEVSNDLRTVQLEDFSVISGNRHEFIVPKGAALTVTEYGTKLNDYSVTATHGDPAETMTVASAETTANNVTTHTRSVGIETVTADDTITYTNTRIAYPVKLIKVDQNNAIGKVEAFFKLDAKTYNIATNLLASVAEGSDGVFYKSADYEPLYAGDTYTLTETWVDTGYEGLKGPVTITVSGEEGKEFTFTDSSGKTVSDLSYAFNSIDGTWEIRVKNQEVKYITVSKILNDPLINQKEFSFKYSYIPEGKTDADKVEGSFTLTPPSTSVAVTKVLTVPLNATAFTVYEDTGKMANTTDTLAETYDTTVAYTGEDTADTETQKTGTDDKDRDISYPTCGITTVTKNGTITFTNKRKTVNISISKTVIGEDTTGDFAYEVKILNGELPINNVTVVDNGTVETDDDWVTNTDGVVKMPESASPENASFTLTHGAAPVTIKLPVGATITVEEKLTDEQAAKGYAAFMTMPGVNLELVNGKADKVRLTSPTEDKTIRVFNIPSVCKVTDENGSLLYVLQEGGDTVDPADDIYIPAIFPTIKGAFEGRDGIGGLGNYYREGSTVKYPATSQHRIEMLVDYEVPTSDVVTVDAGYDMVFTTAAANASDGYPFRRTGEYEDAASLGVPEGQSVGKAVLTRTHGSTKAFFTVSSENATSTTSFEMSKLIIDGDGANLEDNVRGGCLTAYKSDVTIQNCVIYDFVAAQGGAIYTTGDSLTVKDSIFDICVSGLASNKCGGGGIHTLALDLDISDSTFISCTAMDQGGAVYQRTLSDTGAATGYSLTLTDCVFTDCVAASSGAIETPAQTVTVTGCTFTRCVAENREVNGVKIKGRSGGAINIFANNLTNSGTASTATIKNCDFFGCTALGDGRSNNGSGVYGGALRSAAKTNEITGCRFLDDPTDPTKHNAARDSGGGLALTNNSSGSSASVSGCTFTNCTAVANGGGIYAMVATLTIDDNSGSQTAVSGCSAKIGGGVYTAGNVTLKNGVSITGNKLTTNTAANAAGLYMSDGKTLTLGGSGVSSETSVIRENTTANGTASNLRLSEDDGKNAVNSVSVASPLGSACDIHVVNAKVAFWQFGSSTSASLDGLMPDNYADSRIKSDDGDLFGRYKDGSTTVIIWYGEYICKITDGVNDAPLTYGDVPAVFGSVADAFITFKQAEFDDNKTPVQIEMLVASHSLKEAITAAMFSTGRPVILTTADDPASDENAFGYRGGSIEKCTVTRSGGITASMFTVADNASLTVTNIILDGGTGTGLTCADNGGIIQGKSGSAVILDTGAVLQNSATASDKDGGAVYMKNSASFTMRNGASIQGCSARNGGGVYLDETTLILGQEGSSSDASTISGNTRSDGTTTSNVRLSESGGVNKTDSVSVLCPLTGEIGVENPKNAYLQFGTAGATGWDCFAAPANAVIRADDGTLTGIYCGWEENSTKLIWWMEPYCKITDGVNNAPLTYGIKPAVFSSLTEAFTAFKEAEFDRTPVQIEMLVDTYSMKEAVTAAMFSTGRPVILTTADDPVSDENAFGYRGGNITKCTVTRDSGTTASMFTVADNASLTVTNIILDGGTGTSLTCADNGGIIQGKSGSVVILDTGAVLQNSATASNKDGGAVYMKNSASFTMRNGASIQSCSARNGGGVYLDTVTSVSMSGSSMVKGCTAVTKGGGLYIGDTCSLILGQAGSTTDATTVTGNTLSNGTTPSNVRLPESNSVNKTSSVSILCPLTGVIGVENPKNVYLQFGTAGATGWDCLATPDDAVIRADDGTMTGVYCPWEEDSTKLIWWKQPYCKITDGNDKLLFYVDNGARKPALFETDTALEQVFRKFAGNLYANTTTNSTTTPVKIQMLVETYTLMTLIDSDKNHFKEGRPVTLTTAAAGDGLLDYPSSSTDARCKIIRGYDQAGQPSKYDSMFRIYGKPGCSMTLSNIIIDGGSKNGKFGSGDGSIVKVQDDAALVLENGAELCNSECRNTTNGGGAVALESRATVTMKEGSSIHDCKVTGSGKKGGAVYLHYKSAGSTFIMEGGSIYNCTSVGNGGAIYLKNGSTFTMKGGSIYSCTSSSNGAGVYLEEGATLNISGSPSFGGADTERDGSYTFTENVGNLLTTTLSGKTNGGQSYPKARQDIYIAGYSGKTAASVNVTGDITSGTGAIWVWAEQSGHIHRDEQFALMTAASEVSDASLHAFRNARVDGDSGASSDPYYGVKSTETGKETYVVWGTIETISTVERKVILRKVSDNSGTYAPVSATFTIWQGTKAVQGTDIDGSTTTSFKSGTNGVFYVGPLNFGTYYLEETSPTAKWYYLILDDSGVHMSGQYNSKTEAENAAKSA